MSKAGEFLISKGIEHNVEWDTDKCGEFTLTELLEQYADKESQERTIHFLVDYLVVFHTRYLNKTNT